LGCSMMDYANMLRQLMMGAQPIADDPMTRKINKGLPNLGGGGGVGRGPSRPPIYDAEGGTIPSSVGFRAFLDGRHRSDNPYYPEGGKAYTKWLEGFEAARKGGK
jgi:hypothetical protein